jgi:hypothetical protein
MTTHAGPSTVAVVTVRDPLGHGRQAEPIFVDVPVGHTSLVGRDDQGNVVPCQVLRHAEPPDGYQRVVLPVTVPPGSRAVEVMLQPGEWPAGIVRRPVTEVDAVVRLDTGYFELELCRGTGQGTTAAKWGIRHLVGTDDGVDLLPSGNNAIGGFYGPFFTPENGLINPPEHVVADVEVVEEGPVLHRYRLTGVVPDGMLPELRGKNFRIDWQFTLGCPWFERHYHVDDFETVIDGRHIRDKITVGDEFESGPHALVFDRFDSYAGVTYRSGDPYAELLARQVQDILAPERLAHAPRLRQFRSDMGPDIAQASWDFYWRLFSAWEGVLDEPELRRRLAAVRDQAHRAIDEPGRRWRIERSSVDVAAVPDETIFPVAATKTVEYQQATGKAMVWWTSQPSGRFQIVQRRQSGWVNWGTNGENECPELPTGTTIRTAYGRFAENWRDIADALETPLVSTMSATGEDRH